MAYEVLALIRDFELYRITPKLRPEIETVNAHDALSIVGLDGTVQASDAPLLRYLGSRSRRAHQTRQIQQS